MDVLGKKYVHGAWLPVHPPPEFVQSRPGMT